MRKAQVKSKRVKKHELVEVPKGLPVPQDVLHEIALKGDLRGLNDDQLTRYYFYTCQQFGLNPVTKPFDIITFKDGRKVMYANKNCAEQLRILHGISVVEIEQKHEGELYVVKVSVKDKTGRVDGDIGVVSTKGYEGKNLTGEMLANKMMTATTKAKRRATYSICGLGMLDETEVETIPGVTTSVFKEIPAKESVVNPVVNPVDTKELEKLHAEFSQKLSSARDRLVLGTIGKQVHNSDLTEEQKEDLRQKYSIRSQELKEDGK